MGGSILKYSTFDNGGEAFPRPASTGNNYLTGEEGVVVDPQSGMSLRDYFAAKAMTSYLSDEFTPYQDIPAKSYEMADSMIKARDNK